MAHTIIFEEGERQAVLLALACLALDRPGWDEFLSDIAAKMDNTKDGKPEMFSQFKIYNASRKP